MAPPFEYVKIPDQKVAIRDWSAFSLQDIKERLDFGYYSEPDETKGYLFALINALEIRILPSDASDDQPQEMPVRFSWQVVSFSDR